MAKPKPTSSLAERELDKAEKQFEAFDNNIKEMTLDRMNMASKQEVEPQTNLSNKEIERKKERYLKPTRAIGSKEKFNENFRDSYNFSKEYVQFIAENKEIIGENITIWTKPYAGMPAEMWEVPVNIPVWGPRYLAEQIKGCKYHQFIMDENVKTSGNGRVEYSGPIIVDKTVQRLDAIPVSSSKSIFMGASSFS